MTELDRELMKEIQEMYPNIGLTEASAKLKQMKKNIIDDDGYSLYQLEKQIENLEKEYAIGMSNSVSETTEFAAIAKYLGLTVFDVKKIYSTAIRKLKVPNSSNKYFWEYTNISDNEVDGEMAGINR